MHDPLSRRTLLIAGAALFVQGCTRRGERHASADETPPAFNLGAPRTAAAPAAPIAPREPTPTVEQPEEVAPHGGYVLVPRSRWTSQPVAGNNRPMNGVTRITVHHTDEHAGMAGLSDIEIIRRIENYHRGPEKRWAAIGYHYLVGKDGRVYEGRPVRYQGAHVLSENENNLGVSVIGDFHAHLPNARQLGALKTFLDDQRVRFHVPVARVYGHRDLNSTQCPGDALYGWVRSYKRA